MTGKRNLAAGLIALLALLSCAGSVAVAATTMTTHQRVTFERAMARYERALAATTTAQAVAQMRAEESRIDPCVAQLKSVYSSRNPSSGAIDWILGPGSQYRGEQWYAKSAIPLDEATGIKGMELVNIKLTTSVDVCGVIDKWSAGGYAQAERPAIYTLLAGYVSPSPLAAIGTRFSAKSFMRSGFPHSVATRLVAEFNRAIHRYTALNVAVGQQFIGWLKQQFIYELMQPTDRQFIADLYAR